MAQHEAPQDRRPTREQVLDEHQKLMPLVNALAESVDRAGGPDGEWLSAVRERLGSLREALVEHFHEEETGPFGPQLPPGSPHLAGRVADLLSQHPVILRSVDAALATAGRLTTDDLGAHDELKGAVHLLIATIRRHEAAENELVLDAVWDDFGGGD